MRIRGGHIAGLAVAAIFAFVIYAVMLMPEPAAPPPVEDGNADARGEVIPPPFTWSDAGDNAEITVDPEAIREGIGSLPPAGVSDEYAADIELETTDFNVGIVPNDRRSHYPLKVWNKGKVPLRISSIRTTCPCTEGNIKDGTIPPGGESVIDVTIDPFRIGGFTSTKTLTIFSNDPKHGMIEVDVTAEVEPEFELVPRHAEMGTIQKGAAESFTFIVRQLEDDPQLVITQVSNLDRLLADTVLDDVKLELKPVPEEQRLDPAKEEFLIRATTGPMIPPGPFVRRISIDTNVERMAGAPLHVELRGEVQAPYSVSPVYPERLILRPGEAEPPTITVKAEQAIEIVNPEFDQSKLAVNIRNEGNTAYLEVRPAATAPGGRLEAELRFQIRTGGKTYTERIGVIRPFTG